MSDSSIKPLFPALGLVALLVGSCSTTDPASPATEPRPASSTQSSTTRAKPLDHINEPTPEQELRSKEATSAYFQALHDTILDIDDGRTSPDLIARTAVSKNMNLLRAKVAAQSEHFKESSWLGADVVREKMAELPTSNDIDVASYMVLKLRQKHAPSPE